VRVSQPFNLVATSVTRAALRGLGLRSEFAVKHLHRVGNVRCQLPNGRTMVLWSRGDDWVANQVYWRGWSGYEPETAPVFFAYASRAHVVFDVGAHVGFYAVLAAHANPAAKIFAFEPHPRAFERLVKNVARNRFDNVRCLRNACGAADGMAQFHSIDVDSVPSRSTLDAAMMRPEWGLCSWPVEVRALDHLASGEGLVRVDLLKIDVEGTEPDVLRGMPETLRRDRPVIFAEVLPGARTEDALEALLEPERYHYYLLTPEGPHARRRIRAHDTWFNWLFTPQDSDEVLDVCRRLGG